MITLSTVGSIAGVLAIAPLMSKFDARLILYTVSVILILLALVGFLPRTRRAAAAVTLLLATGTPSAQGQEVIFETYSAYHHIMVADTNRVRALLFDDAQQSLMSLENPYTGGFEYAVFFHVPAVFNPTIKKSLFIGLGGGTGPKSFLETYPNMQIDVVEIDPVVVRVAKEYFYLPEDKRLRVHEMDGRVFLQRARGRYDVIIMDAYASGPYGAYLPYHMATVEFFDIVRQKLNNGGFLVYNAIGTFGGMNDNVVRPLLATLRGSFEAVYTFKAKSSVNTVFVAMKHDAERANSLKPWPEGPWTDHLQSAKQLQDLVLNMDPSFVRVLPSLPQRITQLSRGHSLQIEGPILTDNYAPVDITPSR
jgi:spermidine synthase